MTEINLLPPPKNVEHLGGSVSLASLFPKYRDSPELSGRSVESYRILINRDECTVEFGGEAGAYYARKTLEQLERTCGESIPCMVIEDWPDYPVRGLYHDITRGKVPTLETLKHLADICSQYKLNQLHLYIEHTYAYEAFPNVWQDADPLTKEEILELDTYCRERHIELVPSFTTFGHFYPFIHTKRFQHLNELEREVSGEPFNWWDRMQHYTLDCQNPESIELIRTLIEEVRPLFSSNKFNICADETFDLGKGKNKELAERVGKGRLYLDFVSQVIKIVQSVGSTPMMWADIVGKNVDLLPEVPHDVIFLDWSYNSDLKGSIADALATHGCTFYVCSGTSSWNRFLPDYANAHENICKLAKRGKEHGACGHLVTDWGDFGHIAPLALSFPGLILAATVSWDTDSADQPREVLEADISRISFGDETGRLLTQLREASEASLPIWRSLAFWKQPRSYDMPDSWFDSVSGLPDMFFSHDFRSHKHALEQLMAAKPELQQCLKNARMPDALAKEEILFALDISVACEELALCLFDYAGRNGDNQATPDPVECAGKWRELESRFGEVWHARNKPSEYREIAKVIQAIVSELESMPKKTKE